MATPAAGDYSRYQLKPSLINADLNHFRNDIASGALRNIDDVLFRAYMHIYTYMYIK